MLSSDGAPAAEVEVGFLGGRVRWVFPAGHHGFSKGGRTVSSVTALPWSDAWEFVPCGRPSGLGSQRVSVPGVTKTFIVQLITSGFTRKHSGESLGVPWQEPLFSRSNKSLEC